MSGAEVTRGFRRVSDDRVWRLTKRLFLVSLLLFLVNIGLGFMNAVTTGPIPRWQFLTHLHAGTLGWITLSAITVAIWMFTGDRSVSPSYVSRVRLLGWLSALAIVGTIAGFALGFSQGGGLWYVLAVFAPVTALMVWVTAIYALTQLKYQPVATTAHVLLTGGLFVGAYGVTMGTLLGLQNAVGGVVPIPYDMAISVHQAAIDFYLLLVAVAIAEWYVPGEKTAPMGRGGTIHVALGVIPPVLVLLFVVGLAGIPLQGPVLLLTVLGGFLGSMIAFVVRTGRYALRISPLGSGSGAWFFFGSLWLIVYVVGFIPTSALPNGLVVNYHVEFLGMPTNLLLGVLSVRTAAAGDRLSWAEPAAVWLLNGGMVVFFALEIALQSRLGAVVMGLGVLLGVVTMIVRLVNGPAAGATRTPATDAAE
jgi:hypothetical protein